MSLAHSDEKRRKSGGHRCCGRYCFAWPGTIASAVDYLKHHQIAIVEDPVMRLGGRGKKMSVYFRDPDGNPLELISYAEPV